MTTTTKSQTVQRTEQSITPRMKAAENLDAYVFSKQPDYDEPTLRREFAKAMPLSTVVIYCFDPRAVDIPAAYIAVAGAHTSAVATTTIRRTIVVGLVILTMAGSGSLYAQETRPDDTATHDLAYEKYSTGWAFYLDNDALTTGDNDEDYTGGFAVTLSGRRATEYPISLDGWLNGLDRFSRFENLI